MMENEKVMRPLNDDEIKIVNKSLVGLEEESDHLRWLIKFNKLMVDEGLMNNLKEKMRVFKVNIKNDAEELKFKMITIKDLRQQLCKGVKVKKMLEVKDND